MSARNGGIVFLATVLLGAGMAFGGPIYVTPTGAGAGDGSSWANATGSIQAALDLAEATGRSIWIAGGSYDPGATLAWRSGAKAFGGFHIGDTEFLQRDVTGNASIISGAGVRRVLWMDSLVNTRLDGFTILDGYIDGDAHWAGAGAYCNGLDSTNIIINCVFLGNVTANSGHGGGLISNGGSNHIIEKTIFGGNSCPQMGGGLFIHWSSATVRDCLFSNNHSGAAWHGGGVALWESANSIITRSSFLGNQSTGGSSGGGLYIGSNTNGNITQCIFQNNSASAYGGGVFVEQASATLADCIFIGNNALNGGGLFAGESIPSSLSVSRCLFQSNNANSVGGGMAVHGWASQPVTVSIGGSTFQSNTSQVDAGALDIRNPGVSATVNGSSFVDNHAGQTAPGGQGGAIMNLEQSVLTLNRCGFFGNTTQGGGGGAIFNHVRSTLTATNCVFDNNHAPWIGGGVAVWGSAATINHCTFNRNGNGGGNAHGVWVDNSPGAASATITNSILWGPYGPPQLGQNTGGLLNVAYTDVQGGWAGTGNQNTDPLFVDANGICRLQAGSPCRDTADPASGLTVDIYNNARPGAGAGAGKDKGAYEWNNTAPAVSAITPSSALPVNTPWVVYTVTLDEGIGGQNYDMLNGLRADHFTLTTTGSIAGASIVHVAGNTTNRNVVVNTGTGSGTLRLDLTYGAGLACSGNLGLSNVPFTSGGVFTIDKTNPRVTSITRTGSNPTNASTVQFTVGLSESVSGLAVADFDLLTTGGVTGASVTEVTGTGVTRTVTVDTGTGDGTVGIRVGNGAAVFDSAGNMLENWLYDSQAYTVDKTAPDAPVVGSTTPTNALRPVWTWTQGASPGNGTFRHELNSGGWTETTSLSFTPGSDLAEGLNTFRVQERDAAGNWSADSFFDVFVDITPPSAPVVGGATPVNIPLPTWTWTPGGGGNGTYRHELDGAGSGPWTETTATSFAPSAGGELADGPHTLRVQERDDAGNWSDSGAHVITVDTGHPAAALDATVAVPEPTDLTPIPMQVVFDEGVTGFSESDLLPSNATTGNFTAVSPVLYTFSLSPSGQGAFSVQVPANAGVDAAGNGNTASAVFARTFESLRPTAALSSTAPAATNVSPIPVTVAFSSPVTGFDAGDLVTANGAVDNFAGAGANYSFDLVPSGQGAVTVRVPEGVAEDSLGALNTASSVLSRVYDTVAPTVALSSAAPNPTNAPVPVTVTFDEPVYGFTAGDVAALNADVTGFTGADGSAVYTLTLTPTVAEGTISASLGAGAATDAAGNPSAAAPADVARDYDGVAPTVAAVTVVDGLTVDVAFSEPVNAAAGNAANYAVSGAGRGTLSANPAAVAAQSATVYRLSWNAPNEMFDGGALTVTVTGVGDPAGNALGAPNSGTGTAVGEPPVAVCADVTVLLSAPTLAAATVGGGSSDNIGIATMTLDGAASKTYTCADAGTFAVTLRVTDAAGNFDECTASVTVEDNIAPVITIPGGNTRTLAVGSTFTLPAVTAVDNCNGSVPVTLVDNGGIALAPALVTTGVYTLRYEAVDAASNTASATLVVTVQDPVPIVVSVVGERQITRAVGGTASFEVSATGGSSALQYQWKRVTEDKGEAVIDGANLPRLTITPVQLSDAGDYFCEVFDFVTVEPSETFTLDVDLVTVPVAGGLGLALAALASALAGAGALRRRK